MKLAWSLSGAEGVCRLTVSVLSAEKLRVIVVVLFQGVMEFLVSQVLCVVTVLRLLFGAGLRHFCPWGPWRALI